MNITICPHCGENPNIPEKAMLNAEIYRLQPLVKTNCCGKGVNIITITSFSLQPYKGGRKEDDWGDEFSDEPIPPSKLRIVPDESF